MACTLWRLFLFFCLPTTAVIVLLLSLFVTVRHETSTLDPERVAVCFAGNLRTFNRPYIYQSLLRNVVLAIRGKNYHVDVFFNVKTRDNNITQGGPTDANETLFRQIASKYFDPVVVNELAFDDDFIPNNATVADKFSFHKPSFCHPDDYNVIGKPHSLYRFHQCSRLISAHEQERNVSYPYVYAIRPDLWINGTIYLPRQLRRNGNTLFTDMSPVDPPGDIAEMYRKTLRRRKVPYSTDHMMAGTRRVMDVAMNAHSSVDTCDVYKFNRHLPQEMTLLRWMIVHHMEVASDPIPIVIARAGFGPECGGMHGFPIGKKRAMKLAKPCWDDLSVFRNQAEQLI